MVLDPSVSHETLDKLRDPEFAKEQARLQYAPLYSHTSLYISPCTLRALGQRNRHQLGAAAVAFLPLSQVDPDAAKSYHTRVTEFITDAKKGGNLPPGLAEQYDIQLRALLDDKSPDMEIVGFPGFLTALCWSIHLISRISACF